PPPPSAAPALITVPARVGTAVRKNAILRPGGSCAVRQETVAPLVHARRPTSTLRRLRPWGMWSVRRSASADPVPLGFPCGGLLTSSSLQMCGGPFALALQAPFQLER